jgi:hypothetical protein
VLPEENVPPPREPLVSGDGDRELPPTGGMSVRRLELDVSGTEKLPICGLSIWRVGTWPVPLPWVVLIPPMVMLTSPGPAAPVETEPARLARTIEAIRALLMAVSPVYE